VLRTNKQTALQLIAFAHSKELRKYKIYYTTALLNRACAVGSIPFRHQSQSVWAALEMILLTKTERWWWDALDLVVKYSVGQRRVMRVHRAWTARTPPS
jgi:hypothetical protein